MSDESDQEQHADGEQPQEAAQAGAGEHHEDDAAQSTDPEVLLTHAGEKYMAGQYQDAIDAGQRAIAFAQSNDQLARAYYGMALCHQGLNDFTGAAEQMRLLLALPEAPNYPSHQDYQRMFELYQRGQPWQGDIEPAP